MKETVCLVSLGCPKNLVDSEVILGLLSKEGYLRTTDPSRAEIIIVNTCAFIQDATQEAIETILHLTHYKKEGRCRQLIVSGCLPQRYGKILESELPEVDLFVGTGDFQNLHRLLSGKRKKKSFLSGHTFLYNEKTPRTLSTPSFMAYLKIAEGCSNACTFCTVPKIRGPYRSRRLRSLLNEAAKLADQGVRDLLKKIRTFLPEASLRSSLIVGFPGEEDFQFQSLLDFVEETQFNHLGAFKYSSEEGTPASRLPDTIPEGVKEERLRILMDLQKKISLKKYRGMVGRSMEVLVEGPDIEEGRLRGRLKMQAPEIDGSVFLKGKARPGDWGGSSNHSGPSV